MPNVAYGDITVINDSGFQPGLIGAQAGVEHHKNDLTYKPEFRNPRINYQGVKVGWIVGPIELEGDGSGDVLLNPLSGIGAADFVTPFVFDQSLPDIGGAPIGGGNYISELKVSLAAEGGKLATLDWKWTNNKNIP